MPKLIERIYKDKIGTGQCYPIGTEAVSFFLEAVPQFSKLSLFYRNREGASLGNQSSGRAMGKIKQDTSDLIAFNQVLSAYYTHRQASWSIILLRVNKTESGQVKAFLLSIGMPLLKSWLMQDRADTWYNGNWSFQIGINKEMNRYGMREDFSHQLMEKYIGNIDS